MQMHKAMLLLVTALAPTVLFGADGQVLINQSTVIAAGGFPYVISQPGSYKLTGNLVVPFGLNGISIQSSFVTIDLNGFNISSLGFELMAPLVAGIFSESAISNITIRNGSLTNWADAIFLLHSSLALVEDITTQQVFTVGNLNFGGGNAVFLAGLSVVKRVVTDGGITVTCPSIVSESVGFINTTGNGCVQSVNTAPL